MTEILDIKFLEGLGLGTRNWIVISVVDLLSNCDEVSQKYVHIVAFCYYWSSAGKRGDYHNCSVVKYCVLKLCTLG